MRRVSMLPGAVQREGIECAHRTVIGKARDTLRERPYRVCIAPDHAIGAAEAKECAPQVLVVESGGNRALVERHGLNLQTHGVVGPCRLKIERRIIRMLGEKSEGEVARCVEQARVAQPHDLCDLFR